MLWLGIIIFLFGIALIAFLVLRFSASVNQQLNAVTQQLNERLKETSQTLHDTHRTIGERLDSATKVFGEVQRSLGRLEETHKHIYEISKDIASLQDLLRAPKARGEIGETMLGRLLEDILPREHIRLQHRFRSGDIVDAAIIIGENLIPVDAKFSLENFKRFSECPSEEEAKGYYRLFTRDAKNRIDEVSRKYILPDEGTFDFALMYIPAEGVYYQMSKDEEITAYAKSKKVILVSPNTFYAYLQAILYGLKGMNIQRDIQSVFSELGRLQVDFRKFQEDFDLIGGHLSNAAKKYNEAKIKLTHFTDNLTATTERKNPPSPS